MQFAKLAWPILIEQFLSFKTVSGQRVILKYSLKVGAVVKNAFELVKFLFQMAKAVCQLFQFDLETKITQYINSQIQFSILNFMTAWSSIIISKEPPLHFF